MNDVNGKKIKSPSKPVLAGEPDRLSEIYRLGAELISGKGYDATSMSDIAEAVGLTKAGIYHHIPGKEDLLFGIMNFGMDELDAEVIIPARAIPDAESRLRAIITSHVLLITNRSNAQGNNPVTIVIEEVAGLTPDHRRQINQRKRVYVELVRETLAALKAENKLRDIDVTTASFSLLGMILWLSRWYSPNGRLTPEEMAQEISKIALGGVLHSS